MRDDDDDFIEDMIAYHIIMEDEKKHGDGKRPGSGGGCLSWGLFLVVIVLVIGFIGKCTGCNLS